MNTTLATNVPRWAACSHRWRCVFRDSYVSTGDDCVAIKSGVRVALHKHNGERRTILADL